MFSWMARSWFRAPIHDVYCGLRAFTRELYDHLHQRCTGMEFATEMIRYEMQRLIEHIHGQHVHTRRVHTLIQRLSAIIPANARVLDVGSGDGLLAAGLGQLRADLTIEGIDVLGRPTSHIPVTRFDGETIPFEAGTFDVVLFVDVLHHTTDPMILLREAVRVTRKLIVLKDHTRDGLLAGPTLRFMDRVGNSRYGVSLPYNYWREQQWRSAFTTLQLHTAEWHSDLHLYPLPLDWVFGRSLHFIARLERDTTW